jgi:hypothetical protein
MSDNEKEAVMTYMGIIPEGMSDKLGVVPTLLIHKLECRNEAERVYEITVAKGRWTDKQTRDFNYLVGFEAGLELALRVMREANSKHGK